MLNKAALKVLLILGVLFAVPTFLLGILGNLVGQATLFAIIGAAIGLALDLFVFYLISGKYAMLGAKLFFNKNASITARIFKHRGVLLDIEDTKDAIPVYPNQEDSKVTLMDTPPHQDMRSGRPFRFLVQDVPNEVDLLSKYKPDLNARRIVQAINHAFETGLRIGQRLKENRMLMLVLIFAGVSMVTAGLAMYYSSQAANYAQLSATNATQVLDYLHSADFNRQLLQAGGAVVIR